MNRKNQYLSVSISILLGCGLGYACFNMHEKTHPKDYIYMGQAERCLKLTIKNGRYEPDESVLDLDGGVVSEPNVAGIIGFYILKDIYGSDDILIQTPFIIEKDFYSWIVSGSGDNYPPCQMGGVADIVIDRKTGMVINYSHGK